MFVQAMPYVDSSLRALKMSYLAPVHCRCVLNGFNIVVVTFVDGRKLCHQSCTRTLFSSVIHVLLIFGTCRMPVAPPRQVT